MAVNENNYLAHLYYNEGRAYGYVEAFLKMFYLIFGQAYSRNYLDVDTYNKLCVNKSTKIHMPKRNLDEDDEIVAFSIEETNDLDEYSIEKLVKNGAPYDIFAAGTKAVTAYDNPALGGVFKTKQYAGRPVIKVAEGKTTIPNKTNVLRIIKDGKYAGDIIQPANANIVVDGRLATDVKSYIVGSNPAKTLCFSKGEKAYTLLKPLMRNGKFVKDVEKDLRVLQAKAKANLLKLDNKHKEFENSTIYQVGLENSVYSLQQNLIKLYQGR